MCDEQDKKAKILDFIGAAKTKKAAKTTKITVEGDNNIIGDNNTVVNTNKVINKTKVNVVPGEGCIDPQQQGILFKLVHEIYDLEQAIKRKPKTLQRIWSELNTRNGVASYHLTPAARFDSSVKYLRGEIGKLNGMRSARNKNPEWRKSRYAFIHTNCKKYNLTERMRNYIKNNHDAISLTDLSDDQLDAT